MTTVFEVQTVLCGGQPLPKSTGLMPESPFRPPFWRFAAAVQRLGAGETDDVVDLLYRAARLRRIWRHECPSWTGNGRAPNRLALKAALQLSWGPPLTRAEIEARLLAGQTCEEIAARMQLTSNAIGAFEAFFYAVRPRLRQSMWIRHTVLNPANKFGGFANSDISLLWKTFGYNYGPVLVDQLTGSLSHARLEAEGLDGYLCDDVDLPFELKWSIVCARLPLPRTVKELAAMKLLIELRALLRKSQSEIDLAGPITWLPPGDRPLAIQQRCLTIALSLIRAAA